MNRLDALEARSIYVLREAYANFPQLGLLWSIGKDSTVLIWLARKAFFGRIPFPLIHVDTEYKFPEMIEFRNRMARQWDLNLIVSRNAADLLAKNEYPSGKLSRLECCRVLKTVGLRMTLNGESERFSLDRESGDFVPYPDRTPFHAVILGVRADEEGSRSKERYFSPRDQENLWHVAEQPPEFWNQYKLDFRPGTHLRVHPLLDWTELDIWEYVEREGIPLVSLYFDQGAGKRYRSIGCYPCTFPIESTAKTVAEIVAELRDGPLAKVPERAGRAQDKDGGGTLEDLRRGGYM